MFDHIAPQITENQSEILQDLRHNILHALNNPSFYGT